MRDGFGMHCAAHGGRLVKRGFFIGVGHQANIVKGGSCCKGTCRFQQGGYAGSVVIGSRRSGAGRPGRTVVVPVVHAHFGIVMRADDEHFGPGGGPFLDGDEIICRPVLDGAEFSGGWDTDSLARDGITHSLQFLFNVAGGTLHGAGVVDVPFTDGIRQVEYMRFQERFRLVRVRYFSDSAGRKKLGTGAEGDADHRHEQTEPEGHGKEMHGGN